MQGSFEKRVQEKLEEMKLTPSAPVWDKIELQITEEKKHRRGFYWILLGLLLLIGAGWWMLSQKNDNVVSISTTPTATAERKKMSEQKEGRLENKKDADDPTIPALTQRNSTAEQPKATSLTNVGNKTRIQRKTGVTTLFTDKITIHKEGSKNEETVNRQQGVEKTIEQWPIEKISSPTVKEEKTITVQKEDIQPVDSIAQTQSASIDNQQEKKATDTVAAKPKVAAIKKEWKLSMTLATGWSRHSSDQVSSNFDRYASAPQNAGGFSNTTDIPNRVTGGFTYAFGLGVSRAISQRLQFSVGLQYASFRTRTRVGSFKPLDTAVTFQSLSVAVSGYYGNGSQQDFTNRYHVLELPVSIDFKLLRSLPLSFSTGASYGRLLQSNALTYDRNANIYYHNKQNLSQNLFSIFTSLQYGIINKNNFRLQAGPMMQYQLTPFQKENVNASPRLLFAGLKTTVQF